MFWIHLDAVGIDLPEELLDLLVARVHLSGWWGGFRGEVLFKSTHGEPPGEPFHDGRIAVQHMGVLESNREGPRFVLRGSPPLEFERKTVRAKLVPVSDVGWSAHRSESCAPDTLSDGVPHRPPHNDLNLRRLSDGDPPARIHRSWQ